MMVLWQSYLMTSNSSLCFLRHLSVSSSMSAKAKEARKRITRAKVKRVQYNNHNSEPSFLSSNDDEILFGIHPIYAALKHNRRQFKDVYIRTKLHRQLAYPETGNSLSAQDSLIIDIWQQIVQLGIPLFPVNNSKLDKLANYGVHQGICATVSPYELRPLRQVNSNEHSSTDSLLWLFVDNVKDPMNMGALIRSAIYFGVTKLIISPSCSRLSPVVSKASSGAMECNNIYHVQDSGQLLSQLRSLDWDIVGAVCSQSDSCISLTDVRRHHNRKNTLIILGSESHGIADSLLTFCNKLVHIPAADSTPSLIDSLNVGVAAGIMLYQFSKYY